LSHNPDSILVTGGARLEGRVTLDGSKNGSLPLLAAALLTDDECIIHNVPLIEDVHTMIELLRALGARAALGDDGVARIASEGRLTCEAPLEIVRRMRASFWVAGPLLARLRQALVPLPGGCDLGSRPVNFHLEAFSRLGADITVEHGYMKARADALRGATIYQDARVRSMGATMNTVMAATRADGTTLIHDASCEPEVVDLCRFINCMGGRIAGAGTTTLRIDGVARLHGCEFRASCDRIEAGTLLLAGAISRGDVTVGPLDPDQLQCFLDTLTAAGAQVSIQDSAVAAAPGGGPQVGAASRGGAGETTDAPPERDMRVVCAGRPRAVDIVTGPHPSFHTDLQPQMVALLCLAQGTSVVQERVYGGRLVHADELRRMGAEIKVVDQTAIVTGVERLTGAVVQAHNIRAGAALVLAGLAAEGVTEIAGRHHIDRGYANLEGKLVALGARIQTNNDRRRACSA
jgi:UDP-N-acetylglucosamine 1-carboxyvinyltransferase